ncbi:MAG: hypothetical protein DLM56_02405 [Pseudonocardiales bacterium]|nr:MAG: hypothetical protein DLM56_02405 [Pseudonocardiales bacterium]
MVDCVDDEALADSLAVEAGRPKPLGAFVAEPEQPAAAIAAATATPAHRALPIVAPLGFVVCSAL